MRFSQTVLGLIALNHTYASNDPSNKCFLSKEEREILDGEIKDLSGAFPDECKSKEGVLDTPICLAAVVAILRESCNKVNGAHLVHINGGCLQNNGESIPFEAFSHNSGVDCVQHSCSPNEYEEEVVAEKGCDLTLNQFLPDIPGTNTCEPYAENVIKFLDEKEYILSEACFNDNTDCVKAKEDATKTACSMIDGMHIINIDAEFECTDSSSNPELQLGPNGEACVPDDCTEDDYKKVDIKGMPGFPSMDTCAFVLNSFPTMPLVVDDTGAASDPNSGFSRSTLFATSTFIAGTILQSIL